MLGRLVAALQFGLGHNNSFSSLFIPASARLLAAPDRAAGPCDRSRRGPLPSQSAPQPKIFVISQLKPVSRPVTSPVITRMNTIATVV
jgi:hypothetical protein